MSRPMAPAAWARSGRPQRSAARDSAAAMKRSPSVALLRVRDRLGQAGLVAPGVQRVAAPAQIGGRPAQDAIEGFRVAEGLGEEQAPALALAVRGAVIARVHHPAVGGEEAALEQFPFAPVLDGENGPRQHGRRRRAVGRGAGPGFARAAGRGIGPGGEVGRRRAQSGGQEAPRRRAGCGGRVVEAIQSAGHELPSVTPARTGQDCRGIAMCSDLFARQRNPILADDRLTNPLPGRGRADCAAAAGTAATTPSFPCQTASAPAARRGFHSTPATAPLMQVARVPESTERSPSADDLRPPLRHHRADAADQDAEAAEIREAAQRIGDDQPRARREARSGGRAASSR